MIPATPAEQRRLLDLQGIDTAVRKLRHRRANLPEQQALDDNAEMLTRINAEYSDARSRLEKLERAQKRHEDDIAQVESRRKSEEGRMYSGRITSEKELTALRGEISALRARKNDLEDTLLEVMEEREEVESLVDTLRDRHAELTGKIDELTAARDLAATDIDAELTAREQEREAVSADISDPVRSEYESLRDRKQGLGVAELSGRTCSGCRLELTALDIEEVREHAQRALAHCAQCDRILVLV